MIDKQINDALKAEESYKTAVEAANEYIENFDILETITNVGNDEVFTPRKTCDMMLDSLPEEVWHNPNYKWLNPATKNGIFEREIAIRLDEGLKEIILDQEKRRKHILQNMIYAIGQTKFTANVARRTLYYCSQANRKCDGKIAEDGHYVNGYAIGNGSWFNDKEGNIKTPNKNHEFVDSSGKKIPDDCADENRKKYKCKYCGINGDSNYNDANQREKYAYDFIHVDSDSIRAFCANKFFGGDKKMKFDIIIGNPPYQLSDGGGGQKTSSSPIYQKFVNQAFALNAKYVCMIIPARWTVKGKGKELEDFKNQMLGDHRVIEFHLFPNSTQCFPNNDIPGGVCFFSWQNDYDGKCYFYTHTTEGDVLHSQRYLKEGDMDVVVRDSRQLSILKKVSQYIQANNCGNLSNIVSARNPFGLDSKLLKEETLYKQLPDYSDTPFENCFSVIGMNAQNKRDIKYFSNKFILKKGKNLSNCYKLFLGKATVGGQTLGEALKITLLGQPICGNPNELCTDSYLVLGPLETPDERDKLLSFLSTKTVRFLLGCRASSQNLSRDSFSFIPSIFKNPSNSNDKNLFELFKFTQEEQNYISEMIGEVSWAPENFN